MGPNTGYAEGVAGGLAWGQAHGASKTLKALLARAPSLAAHTSEVSYPHIRMHSYPLQHAF